ncbi:hypothetical protein JOF53_008197 [Crossiella equi]|uniref:Potassium channel domain-containing protein n=1 Tax=Crossiella equi TaxID=130796 RepID=A0ABS5ARY8_9PSEU|nr:hypothetical protein [Crossiella equi]
MTPRPGSAAVLRPLLLVAVLVTGYYLLPAGRDLGVGALLAFLGGLALVVALLAWQVRRILASPWPVLQGVAALVMVSTVFLLLFALSYHVLEQDRPHSFTAPLGRTDALYLSVTVFATVGFGDLTPVTEPARILVTVQMVGDLLLLGLALRVVLAAVERARRPVPPRRRPATARRLPTSRSPGPHQGRGPARSRVQLHQQGHRQGRGGHGQHHAERAQHPRPEDQRHQRDRRGQPHRVTDEPGLDQ